MMGHRFQYRKKIPVGILGATGSVGQRFIELLAHHPWFEIAALAASERSAGKSYSEAVHWIMPSPLPEHIASMKIMPCEPNLPCKLVFSSLDSSIAGNIEQSFASAGYAVISNSKNHRMDSHVPLLIPEVNGGHLEALKQQKYGEGSIVTNPNCCVIGLALGLKPLEDHFGLEAIHAVTFQAISGAGYPGVASLDIIDNVIPFIQDEEDKIETETLKILGEFNDHQFKFSNIKISAQCNRVPVNDGHMACVSIWLKNKIAKEEILQAWHHFTAEPQKLQLPSAPNRPIHYFESQTYPQPKLHRNIDKGMAVSVGRLRECPIFDYKFVLLSHNTIRGAAGGAILNAELMVEKGLLFW